jgi:cholesterol transport system auxiliary component
LQPCLGVKRMMLSALISHGLASCALSSNAPPLEIRYFSPVVSGPETVAPAHTDPIPLRLGRVTPSSHLRYRIVHRSSDVEVSLYEALRWTERPDAYVRRALERELFEVRPMTESLGGSAPTLEVEVLAFEEVRRANHRAGRIELRYQLESPTAVLASGVIAMERPAKDDRIESVVTAIGEALSAASSQLAELVESKLQPAAPNRDEETRSPT